MVRRDLAQKNIMLENVDELRWRDQGHILLRQHDTAEMLTTILVIVFRNISFNKITEENEKMEWNICAVNTFYNVSIHSRNYFRLILDSFRLWNKVVVLVNKRIKM